MTTETVTAEPACPWIVWLYSLRGGWERGSEWPTRDEAREVRELENVGRDGMPPECVTVRHVDEGRPLFQAAAHRAAWQQLQEAARG